jgi:hypothetical protein
MANYVCHRNDRPTENGVDVMEDESASYSGTGVTCGEDGTQEVSIKQEDSIAIKEDVSINN